MKSYRFSTNLKLGLIVFAVLIAVASLWYTNDLVDRLRERETSIVRIWARAFAQISKAAQQEASNPYRDELRELETLIEQMRRMSPGAGTEIAPGFRLPGPDTLSDYRFAIAWAQSMPPASELDFSFFIIDSTAFGIPVVVVDSSSGQPSLWDNVDVGPQFLSEVDSAEAPVVLNRLERIRAELAMLHDPIPIEISFPAEDGSRSQRFVQQLYYGESALVTDLRWFPYVQLLFVGLFIVVGYLGFSYVRRSEQSSLWVGMAKEAAHQLGTPISSLMGWVEVLKMDESGDTPGSRRKMETFDEIEQDIDRLRRVASRFSDIGSLPKLETRNIGQLVENTTDYMRRRLPSQGSTIRIDVDTPPDVRAPVNAELFEWVLENLLKNAMDAIDSATGRIDVSVLSDEGDVRIDVVDTGRGIDRREWKNIFRPGYSTKKRGWGLGLSLAKRIVEDYHGGSLVVSASREGEGSTFSIRIPAA